MPMSPEQQEVVYKQLVELVKARVPDDFAVREAPGRLDIDTTRSVVVAGRERDSLNLLSVIIQKHHIGFYFMPVYVDTALRDDLSPELDRMLKGKSCFHVTAELDDERRAQFAALIDQGVALYHEKAWV